MHFFFKSKSQDDVKYKSNLDNFWQFVYQKKYFQRFDPGMSDLFQVANYM